MRPHAELVLECARGRPDAGAIDDLAKRDLDWPAFISFAERHDLRSLCFWRLQRFCPEAIPAEIFDLLREHFRNNANRNLLMTGELFRIVDALESGGAPVAAFKGPALAWRIYETPGVREYMDLDLLVHQEDIRGAQQLLGEIGYRPAAPMPELAESRLFKSGGQLVLIRDAPRVILDLHWDLAPGSMGLPLTAGMLWPQLSRVSIGGRPVLSFDQDTQLILCALHGGKHGWTTLAWLADIAAIIEGSPVDWDRVLAGARTKRLSRALFLALGLCSDLLKTPLPSEVLRLIRLDPSSIALAREARSYLLNGPGATPFFPRRLEYQLRLTEGRRRQMKLLRSVIMEPNIADWESRAIRPSLVGLYCATRPFRLAVKYFRIMVARLWRAGSRGSFV
jgi:hypothetical protein